MTEITLKQEKEKTEQIRSLFNKYKKYGLSYKEPQRFKEPCLILMRRNGQVNFFENIKTGNWEFEHSDGTLRYILINKDPMYFDYGKEGFKGYICHEDVPLPMPFNILATTEEVNMAIEKSLHDLNKFKAQEINARTNQLWTIALGAVIVILAIAMYMMLKPPEPAMVIQQLPFNMT